MNASSLVTKKIVENVKDLTAASNPEVQMFFEVDNGMRILNPLSQHECPNTFVTMRPAFEYNESKNGQFLQTHEIRASGYPMWNFKSHVYTVPLSQANLDFIDNGHLEFEVFHKSNGYGDTELQVKETNHLIGVAFVPLKKLREGAGKTRVTGLFDVIGKSAIYSSMQSLKSLGADGSNIMGKIKIAVTVNININKLLSNPDDEVDAPKFKHLKPSNDFSLSTAPIDKEVAPTSQF